MLLKTSSLHTCSEATALNKKAIQIQKLYDACRVKGLHLVSVTLDTSLVEEQLLRLRNIVGEIRGDIHSFTHSFAHSTINSFIYSFIYSFTHSLIYPFIHSQHSFIHLLIHSFTRLFI